MVYVCEKCNAEFKKLCNYENHLNNKTSCDPIERKQIKINNLTCVKCKKTMSSYVRLKGHLNVCNVTVDTSQQELKQMIENLAKQNEILNEKIDKLANKESKTINISNNVSQNQYVFNILPFGKEKFDYITDKEFNKIFSQGFRSLQMLIPLIYCNENYPENMNVYIKNYNNDKIMVFIDGQWMVEDKSYILENMYNSKRDFLELKFEELYDKLSSDAKYYFERFMKGNTDRETIDPIIDELKNFLYVNRHKVMKKPIKQLKLVKNIEMKAKINTLKMYKEKKPNKKIKEICDVDYIPNKPLFFK